MSFFTVCLAPPPCGNGKVWHECGSECGQKCGDDPEKCNPAECTHGCFCPFPTQWNGDECVPPQYCPCVRDYGSQEEDLIYPVGAIIDSSPCQQW